MQAEARKTTNNHKKNLILWAKRVVDTNSKFIVLLSENKPLKEVYKSFK